MRLNDAFSVYEDSVLWTSAVEDLFFRDSKEYSRSIFEHVVRPFYDDNDKQFL